MSDKRITKVPAELRDQLAQAILGIQGEPNWPVTAPGVGDVINAHGFLSGAINTEEASRIQNTLDKNDRDMRADEGFEIMKRIDQVTDGLYGPGGAQKNSFGLPPKKTGGASVPLEQVAILKIGDGIDPASIALRWEAIKGAASYQIEWYSDVALTQRVGNDAVSVVEYSITGLTPKTQYWIRVRAIRGDEHGQWSDISTRVANI